MVTYMSTITGVNRKWLTRGQSDADDQCGPPPWRQLGSQDRHTNRALHVIVPGMKQRTLTPIGPYSGQTSVTLALFCSSMTAWSGT
jgi:hypothetical protein